MKKEDIQKIAKEKYLNEKETNLLVGLMKRRFPDEASTHYVGEWATRIQTGNHMFVADSQTLRDILDTMKEYGYKTRM